MKYVILGSGNISNTYIRAIAEMRDSKVVGCISRNGRSPNAMPSLQSFGNLSDFKDDFDAVIVATPNGLHASGIIEAANLGKHVLTEKPLGINQATMSKAIEACKLANVKLAVAYQRRTAPDNQTIKALIDNGNLGQIFAADLAAKFYRNQAYYDSATYRGGWAIDGGGPFIQQACHNIDLYVWFFGMPNKVISLLGRFTHHMEAEDHGAVLLKYDRGMIGTFIASTSTKPGFAARLEVHSDLGSFTMLDDAIVEWHFDHIPNPANKSFQYGHDGATSMAVTDVSAHKKILVDFEAAISNDRSPLVDGESAKLTSELILQIYDSNIGDDMKVR